MNRAKLYSDLLLQFTSSLFCFFSCAGSSLAVGSAYGGNFMEIAPNGAQYPRHDSLPAYQDDLYATGMASSLPAAFHKHYLATSFR